MSNAARGGLTGAATGAAQGAMVGGPVGAVIGGVLGGISGIMSGSAADDAKKIGRMNKQLIDMQTDENVRRQKMQMEMEVGTAVAQVAQSDLLFTGSSKRYVNELKSQWMQDVAMTQREGYLRRDPTKPRAIEVRWDSNSGAADVERRPVRHVSASSTRVPSVL